MIVHQNQLWINTDAIAFYDEDNEYLHFISGEKVRISKEVYIEILKQIANRKSILR